MDDVKIYAESLVWDAHCGFELWPGTPLEPLLAPWRNAGVDFLSINVAYDPQPWFQAILNLADIRRRLSIEVPYCLIVETVADIDRARASGQMAVAFDIEGTNSLDGRAEMVELYHRLGVRQMLIAYNRNNLAGSGCHDEDIGLTPFGRQVVSEMNRVGMIVDCSHCGVRTTMDVMEHSTAPVVFSHSNPRALADHERNISDEQIRACASTGGVIGINGINLFLGEVEAHPATVARHIAYIAELVGSQHVGLCLDYAPNTDGEEDALAKMFASSAHYWPKKAGYDGAFTCLDVALLPEVTKELVAVGFATDEISGILGANFRRVAEQVWK